MDQPHPQHADSPRASPDDGTRWRETVRRALAETDDTTGEHAGGDTGPATDGEATVAALRAWCRHFAKRR